VKARLTTVFKMLDGRFLRPGHADAFVRERLPAAVAARLTDTPAVDRSESFIDPLLRERRGDRVFVLETETGQTVLVWTMVEHKSAPEPDSLIQTLTGLAGIAARGAVRRQNPDGTVWQVPAPVFPIVLYHGARRWPLPTSLSDAYDLPPDLVAQGLLDFRYTLVDLGAIPDAELSRHPPLQAGLLVLKYAMRDDDPMDTLERLVDAAAVIGLTALALVVRYLFKASDLVDPTRLRRVVAGILPGQGDDVVTTVAEQLIAEGEIKGRAEGELKGRVEGELKGRAEGKAELLLRLMTRRFGPVAPDIEARIHAADAALLDNWGDRILDARSLADVFGADPRH